MVYPNEPELPAYDDPDEKWEAIAASLDEEPPTSAASEPLAAVEWGGVGDEDALGAVASVLHRDGVCMIRNALPAETALAIHSQMEPSLAARAEAVGLSKQSAGDSGRRAGRVLSASRASWDAAMHPLVMELCAGVLGRQVLMKSREEMQSQLFHSNPQSLKRPFRQHPFQLDFSGVVEVAPDGGAEQDLHLDTGKHVFEFRNFLDARYGSMAP